MMIIHTFYLGYHIKEWFLAFLLPVRAP